MKGTTAMTNILAAGRADDYSALETARTEAEARRRRLKDMKKRTEEATRQ
jgi:hypothetical protein